MGIQAGQVSLKLTAKNSRLSIRSVKAFVDVSGRSALSCTQKLGPKFSHVSSGHHCRENGCWRAAARVNFDPPILLGGGKADPNLAHQSAGVVIGCLMAFEFDTFLIEHGVIRPQEMEIVSRHWLSAPAPSFQS